MSVATVDFPSGLWVMESRAQEKIKVMYVMRGRRRSSATSWVVFQWMCRVVFKWEAQKLQLTVNSEPADCETQNSELRNSWSDLVQSAVDRLNMNKAWTLQTTDAWCYNSAWLETYTDLYSLLYKMKCAQRCVEQQNSCLRIYKWHNYLFIFLLFTNEHFIIMMQKNYGVHPYRKGTG